MQLIPIDHTPHVVAANELRHTLSCFGTPEAPELLIRALDARMGWETATHAVAQGIAERFPSVDPRERGRASRHVPHECGPDSRSVSSCIC